MAAQKPTANEAKILGAKFVRSGLELFIFGLILGYGPLAHYLHGAFEDTGEAFLKNMTLWFACPWTLATYTVQVGALGMVAIGAVYWLLPADNVDIERRIRCSQALHRRADCNLPDRVRRLLCSECNLAVLLLCAGRNRKERLVDRPGSQHRALFDRCCARLPINSPCY